MMINKEPVSYKWIEIPLLKSDMASNPKIYSVWITVCLEKVIEYLKWNQKE